MTVQPIENVFGRAWELLRANPIIIVPGLVIGLISGALVGAMSPVVVGDAGAFTVTTRSGSLLGSAISLLAQVLTIAYTTGMAGAAWDRGRTTLADGTAAFKDDGLRIAGAILLYALIAIVLAIVTFGLGAVVFAFLALYAMPAVVLAREGPITALRESAKIAIERWAPTAIMIVVLFVVALCVGAVAVALAIIPFLGPIVAAVVLQALICYFTIVIVGEYRNLRPGVVGGP